MAQDQQEWKLPPVPQEPQDEGARWRFHRPSSKQVGEWFATVPLDEGMEHAHYIGGVVLIPQTEKAKHTNLTTGAIVERYEQVFTPYVQIGTRVAYARRLAEHRGLIYRAEPAKVPRSTTPSSIYFNGNMDEGLWWHVVSDGEKNLRYLCATWTVALYEPASYAAKLAGKDPLPLIYGHGTKQVSGGPDPNAIMKAQTGAIGRALGVAGILTIGTGIATAEDMQEFSGLAAAAPSSADAQLPTPSELPQGGAPQPEAETLEGLQARAMELQTRMTEETPEAWREIAAWYGERKKEAGWSSLTDAPLEALRGIIARMERAYVEAKRSTEVGA